MGDAGGRLVRRRLEAGECRIAPRIDDPAKETEGAVWAVAGLDRADAEPVSRSGGRPAYGGSPSDGSVRRAIQDLKARGLRVALLPFVLMDVPEGKRPARPVDGRGRPAALSVARAHRLRPGARPAGDGGKTAADYDG